MIKIGLGLPSAGEENCKKSTTICLMELHTAIVQRFGSCAILDARDKIESARNRIVDMALAQELTHVLFVDMDMAFPAKTAEILISADLDIIGCNAAKKQSGDPVIYRNLDGQDLDYITGGIAEVEYCGTGILLVKTDVFRSIEWPWFYTDPYRPERVIIGEDIVFTRIARKKYGYKLFCDLDLSMEIGHIGEKVVTLEPIVRKQIEERRKQTND
jgi:hypothetical protein